MDGDLRRRSREMEPAPEEGPAPGTEMTRGKPLEEPSFQLPKLLDIWAAGPFTSWPRSLRQDTRVTVNLIGRSAGRKGRSRILREKAPIAAARGTGCHN
jgi:hypothetical protein